MVKISTQDFLEVEDVKEGVLILKNKDLRGILMISSINFALKSDEEQNSIIYAYQDFLSTLDFSCQILVRSRKINITPYLDDLRELERKQTNELLKKQTEGYREFIKKTIKGQEIMTKNFYLIVPYSALEGMGTKETIESQFNISKILESLGLKKGSSPQKSSADEDAGFQNKKNQLWQRMEFAAMGLRRCGLESIPLTTSEIIELFWATHHPKQAEIGYYPEILPELLI